MAWVLHHLALALVQQWACRWLRPFHSHQSHEKCGEHAGADHLEVDPGSLSSQPGSGLQGTVAGVPVAVGTAEWVASCMPPPRGTSLPEPAVASTSGVPPACLCRAASEFVRACTIMGSSKARGHA